MAQSWRVKARRHKKERPPLDSEGLERLALHYAGRYATTRSKLAAYLGRKLRERGWAGGDSGPGNSVESLIERFVRLGYVDDRAFASAKAASLMNRGYGERRVDQALRAAGIGEEEGEDARSQAREGAWSAALRFAERKRIGPWAQSRPDRDQHRRTMAAMIRAGHPIAMVRRLLDAEPGAIPESDDW
jgi:regulatory protein